LDGLGLGLRLLDGLGSSWSGGGSRDRCRRQHGGSNWSGSRQRRCWRWYRGCKAGGTMGTQISLQKSVIQENAGQLFVALKTKSDGPWEHTTYPSQPWQSPAPR